MSCNYIPIGAGLKGRPVEKKKERKWWEPVPDHEQKIEPKSVVIDLGKCPKCSAAWLKGATKCSTCGFEAIGTEAVRVIHKREPKPQKKAWKPLPSLGIPTAIFIAVCGYGGYYLVGKVPKPNGDQHGSGSLIGLLAMDPVYDEKAPPGKILGVGMPVQGGPTPPPETPHEDFKVLSSSPEKFKLSETAGLVSFASSGPNAKPWAASFSLEDRGFRASGPTGGAPNQEGLAISDWKDSANPTLSGKALELDKGELSHSLAVASDHTFLLGCDHSIRKFKDDGTPVWTATTTSPVWSLNLDKKGDLIVAALGDGTIRWLRAEDHRELLILYVKREQTKGGDRAIWAVWTHEGYFDCSPGAESIAGLSVSSGPGAPAGFYPLSCFRDSYYRPDIIRKTLETHDVDQAARQSNEEKRLAPPLPPEKLLPPVVHISKDPTSDPKGKKVTVLYTVRTPSGEPVKKLVFQVDGRPVLTKDNLNLRSDTADTTDSITLDLDGGTNISVIAQNDHAWSEASTAQVQYRGDDGKLRPLPPGKWQTPGPKTLYLLSVGVNRTATHYDNLPSLTLAAKDASDFAEAIYSHRGKLFDSVVKVVRRNDEATAKTVRQDLANFAAKAKKNDVIVVFLSGHGISNANFDYHYVPYDYDPQHLNETSITRDDLENVSRSKAKVLFFIDTCHSGRAVPLRGENDITKTIDDLSSPENGAIVYSACAGYQLAAEARGWGNGAFTRAAVEGISGKADVYHQGKVMTDVIGPYLTRRVAAITGNPDDQTPYISHPPYVRDFAIAVDKAGASE